ncbi:MAG: ribonuclease HII [Mariprofundaceae bacterium]
MIAGVDEVGRGPLAGPVVTAAVILSESDPMMGQYRDSKKVSEKKRLNIYHHIRKHAVAYAIAQASIDEIEELNILHATLSAMHTAVKKLSIQPTKVLIDGNHVPPGLLQPAEAIIGGDDSIQQIAAASIVAKVVRDRMMCYFDYRFPAYQFAKHKGYGTKVHMAALNAHGPCPIHRLSFAPVAKAAELHGKVRD